MPASVLIRRDTRRLARRRKPRGSFPRRFLAFLFENLCTAPLVCRRPRALPASRTFGGPAPAAKYTYIDAFNGKTVTRETLLRYTFKSCLVNVLIRGFLWKIWSPWLNSPFTVAGQVPVASALSHGVSGLGAFHLARYITLSSRPIWTELITALLLFP